MGDLLTKPRAKQRPKIERPRLYKVILLNDDFTPREFVVTVLKAVFRMTADQAYRVMLAAHQQGACVVAINTRDVAESKATEATDAGPECRLPAAVHNGAGGVVLEADCNDGTARLWFVLECRYSARVPGLQR